MHFSSYSHRKKHSNLFAVLLSFGIISLVSGFVFLFAKKKLSAGMRGAHLDTISLIVFAIFTVLALIVYFRTRIKIEAGYRNGIFVLEVHDRFLPQTLVIGDPYTLSKHWTSQYVRAGINMTILYLTVNSPDGTPLVSFSGMLGAIYKVPDDFENASDPHRQLADKVYDMGRIRELSGVLSRHLDKAKN